MLATYALPEINGVYIPLNKLSQGIYFNYKSNSYTTAGLESLLHEALHIWHTNHADEVEKLLKSKGSYYDKIIQSKKICEHFMEASYSPAATDFKCGKVSNKDILLRLFQEVKWPSRCNSTTNRVCPTPTEKEPASFCQENSYKVFDGKKYCTLIEKEEGWSWDLHSMDDDTEYFAILMQLYIFSPDDFNAIATSEERKFADNLFAKFFNYKKFNNAVKGLELIKNINSPQTQKKCR